MSDECRVIIPGMAERRIRYAFCGRTSLRRKTSQFGDRYQINKKHPPGTVDTCSLIEAMVPQIEGLGEVKKRGLYRLV